MFRARNLLAAGALVVAVLGAPTRAGAGSIFLTGHDPDFHSHLGGNSIGSMHINQIAVGFIMDPLFNPFASLPFLFVESSIPVPSGHTRAEDGIVDSGFTAGVDFIKADAGTLDGALDQLGVLYGGIVVASDFGGTLTQAELNILNGRSSDIISFLNDGGGLYAMAESNNGAQLTPVGGHFGFLPFIVASSPADQGEAGNTLTAFGLSLGLVNTDINGNFSHNIFTSTGGMTVVDIDAQGRILSLATRSRVTSGGVPEPAGLLLLGAGLAAFVVVRRRARA